MELFVFNLFRFALEGEGHLQVRERNDFERLRKPASICSHFTIYGKIMVDFFDNRTCSRHFCIQYTVLSYGPTNYYSLLKMCFWRVTAVQSGGGY
jgi:hypothetical protein